MDSIEDLTAVNALDDIIINAIKTIRKNKININERLTSMSNNNRITNGKNSYFVTNNE